MRVLKRSGEYQDVSFDKILQRISSLVNSEKLGVLYSVKSDELTKQVIGSIYDGMTTKEIDDITGEIAANKGTIHPDYSTFAARIFVSNLHKTCPKKFSEAFKILHNSQDSVDVINDNVYNFASDYFEYLDSIIISNNDYLYDYFGLKTLENKYLLKNTIVSKKLSETAETPQYLLLRVALGLHCSVPGKEDLQKAIETYKLTSKLFFTHATPTLFNSGTKHQQNSSCFLMGVHDSMSGIMDSIKNFAVISKHGGGVGIHVSEIRGQGSIIKGTNGTTDGLVKMLKIYNETAKFANQGSKRNGSLAVYLEPHHPDILDFLELKLPSGSENLRARDLFYALWISDKFMEAVDSDSDWYLLSSDECPGLTDTHSEEYSALYDKYVSEGKYREKVKAREIWKKILVSQIETGMPYMLYKDSVNRKSNQSNVGTVKSSNLCVAPETNVLTSKGYKVIKDLENQEVDVWNGQSFSTTMVVKTNEKAELLRVTFSDSGSLECTKYHKFYLKDGSCVRTLDLRKGTELLKNKFPVILDQVEIEWVNWVLDGALEVPGGIEIHLVSKSFLESLKFSLQCLGCNELVISETKTGYKLKINDIDLNKLYLQGIKIKNFTVTPYSDNYSYISVVSVEDLGRIDSTYCFTEEKRGMGVFNGVLTGNCAEVMLVSDPEKEEIAVCNIATISLPKFVTPDKQFDFEKLEEIVKVITNNLNNVIDVNFYPVKETENSNKKHRPIIIGTQGLANLFFELSVPFESKEAEELNFKIFEAIQYTALKTSNELAKIYGPYSTFTGSPSSKGIFQHNMWGKSNNELSGRYDWDSLKESVKLHGLRNCLLTGSPPTASTSQILGNYESFEPVTNNFMIRSTLSGEFPVINKYLILDLLKLNLWDNKMKNKILSEKGSIQGIQEIPGDIKKMYKTVWEISQKTLINLSKDRGLFTDHSQSLNIYMKNPNIGSLTSMHFYGWRQGLKTGLYYCRSQSTAKAIDITVEKEQLQCSLENRDNCDMCSG